MAFLQRKELLNQFKNSTGDTVDNLPSEDDTVDELPDEVEETEEGEETTDDTVDELPDEEVEGEEKETTPEEDRAAFDKASKDSEDGFEKVDELPDHFSDEQKQLVTQVIDALSNPTTKGSTKLVGNEVVKPLIIKMVKTIKGLKFLVDGANLVMDVGGFIINIADNAKKAVYAAVKGIAISQLEKQIANTVDSKVLHRLKEALKLIKEGKGIYQNFAKLGKIAFGVVDFIVDGTFSSVWITKKAVQVGKIANTKYGKQFSKWLGSRAIPWASAFHGGWNVYDRNIEKGESELYSTSMGILGVFTFLGIDTKVTAINMVATIKSAGFAAPIAFIAEFILRFASDLTAWDKLTGDETIKDVGDLMKDYYANPKSYNEAIWGWLREMVTTPPATGSEGSTKDPAGNPPGHIGSPLGPQITPGPNKLPGVGFSAAKAPLDEDLGQSFPLRQTQSVVDRKSSLLDELDGVKKKKLSEQQKAADEYIAAQRGSRKSRY